MEETGNLQVFEVFTLDSLSERDIGRSVVDLHGMTGIVVGVGLALSENIHDVRSGLFDEIHGGSWLVC